jgi:hydroxypyruvate isomerase
MISQSIAWWCFVPARLTPQAFVRAAAEAGYAAVELVPPEYLGLVREHGLAVSGIAGHGSITNGLNRRVQHDRIERELRVNLAAAEQWGIANLICFSGSRAGLSDTAGIAICAEGLARVAPAAEAAGVNLVLEVLNSKVDHTDYQADHTAWAVEVCRQVASPRVKVLYDIYHMQIMEGDLVRTVGMFHPFIAHYHTAGNPGRNELDEAQEINYPAVLRAITATGYAGYVAHEYVPKAEPVASMQATLALCAPYL